MSGLPVAVRERLTKICGLLASSHDGERATAAAMASRVLAEHGITWADLVNGGPRADSTTDARFHRPPDASTHADIAADLLQAARTRPELLTAWERQFCEGIAAAPRLSEKQARLLVELCDKADRILGPAWRVRGAAA